jgi:hypothetical protein
MKTANNRCNFKEGKIMVSGSLPGGFSPRNRLWVLIGIAIAGAAAVMIQPPIPQWLEYHSFADQRTMMGIPNFWNVMSNLPFLIFGLIGIAEILGRPALPMRTLYLSFFAGACLVAFGSGYYHVVPGNQSLVWDRLPMVIVFMAFFAIIVNEHINENAGPLLFVPLLLLGLGSVIYWHFTEQAGHGDLRPYAITQFLPMVLIPLILLLFPSKLPKPLIWALLGTYVLAKVLELADAPIHALTAGAISGHSLKHVSAAVGVYLFLLAIRRRYPLVSAHRA